MENIKIAYQGIAGAYSQQAIEEFGKEHSFKPIPISKNNFRSLFDAISQDINLGMVPIENSTAGSVVNCYDLFFDYENLEIIAEYYLSIRHCLLGNKGVNIKNVKKVISHPQALSQCSNFIEKMGWQAESVFDTAGSAKILSDSEDIECLAIASELAGKQYKLEIIKTNFQNNLDNTTRFLLVKKKGKKFPFEEELKNKNKTSLMFETKHIPSALYKALGGFATNQINLTKIESRPKKGGKKFEPVFYIDLEGNIKEENVKRAIEELEFFSKKVRILGSYPQGSKN